MSQGLTYTTAYALLTTKKVELVDEKNFNKVVVNENIKAFTVHINLSRLGLIKILLVWEAQMILLLIKEVIVLTKYADFANIFSKALAKLLPEIKSINEYTIKLVNSNQTPYKPIYSRSSVDLEIFQTYIKTN